MGRARRRTRAGAGAYVLAVAGAILLVAFLGPLLGLPLDGWWLSLLFGIAMAAGLGALAATVQGSARIALAIAAIGWLVRVVAVFVPLGPFVDLGNLMAVFGGIAAAFLLLSARANRAGAGALVAAMLLSAAFVYPTLVAFLPSAVGAVIPLLFGAALVTAGVLLPRR
jgi:hypothetical protein